MSITNNPQGTEKPQEVKDSKNNIEMANINEDDLNKPQTEKLPEVDESQESEEIEESEEVEVYSENNIEKENNCDNINVNESQRAEILSENANNIEIDDIKNEDELKINPDILNQIKNVCNLNEPEDKAPTKKSAYNNNVWLKNGFEYFLGCEIVAAFCFAYPILGVISYIIAGISAIVGVGCLITGIVKSIIQCREDRKKNEQDYQKELIEYEKKKQKQNEINDKINENTSLSEKLEGFKLLLDVEPKEDREKKFDAFITLKNKYFSFSIDNTFTDGKPIIWITDHNQKDAFGQNKFSFMQTIFPDEYELLENSKMSVSSDNQYYNELIKFVTDQLERNYELIQDASLQSIIKNPEYVYKDLAAYRYLADITKSKIDKNLMEKDKNKESDERLQNGLSDIKNIIKQLDPSYEFDDEKNVEAEQNKDRINEIQKQSEHEEEEKKSAHEEEDKKSAHEEEEEKEHNNGRVNGLSLVGINESDIVRNK